MLKAYLRNKVSRELVRREDVVTSCVFGTLEASGQEGVDVGRRFFGLGRGGQPRTAAPELPVERISYEFWPWLESFHASAEPDVLVTLEQGTTRSLIAVEAKLDSGKSSFATDGGQVGDQLGREWLALRQTSMDRGIEHYWVVYLTADLAPPDDMMDARREIERKHPEIAGDVNIVWLSWRDLTDLITPGHGVALRDLRTFLLKEHLGYFEGFGSAPRAGPRWRFDAALPGSQPAAWVWPRPTTLPRSFCFVMSSTARTSFTWAAPAVTMFSWRFQP